MAERPNFLLGRGERLTEPVVVRPGGQPRVPPYSFTEARDRVAPMLESVATSFDSLPAIACPGDQAVGRLTLNPEYISKTAYPAQLLHSVGLQTIGSRPQLVRPEKRSKGREPEETLTTELFIAGTRSAFRAWAADLPQWKSDHRGAEQLAAVERVAAPEPKDKVKPLPPDADKLLFEVVLHAGDSPYLLQAFKEYLLHLGLEADFDHRIAVGGLCFIPVSASRSQVDAIAKFTFLRAIRQMPKLRLLRPPIRAAAIPGPSLQLPLAGPMDSAVRAAIFDGGLPPNHPTALWATAIDPPGINAAVQEYLEHGQSVTSAALFGHIDPQQPVPMPFGKIDHYRVLDSDPNQNPLELYDTLGRISAILSSEKYEFMNFSIGPEVSIEDDEVHSWTAVLDEHLADGEALATIAVGNGGERDADLGFNRIQVPADSVNGLSIGACDSRSDVWQRAPYSSVGPGRSPGVIKPDIVAFGGSLAEPYLALGLGATPNLMPTGGTSFAAPDVMRLGMGIRAHFGQYLRPLAIKSLLIHASEPSGQPRKEIGWGRVAQNLEDIVICPSGVVRIVYQGEVTASKYQRASIPVPISPMPGLVKITATLCFATSVDAHHPGNYTRSGLEVVFRPRDDVFAEDAKHPTSKSFFGKGRPYQTEDELRRNVHKWENCLHQSVTMRGSSLKNPVFDIHHNARADGHDFRPAEKLKYALVITIEAPRVNDLYDQVMRRYPTQLEALLPVIDIPIQAKR